MGFSGSRSLPASFGGLVAGLVLSVEKGERGVAVGCASGLDALVRQRASSPVVFRAAGRSPGQLVTRSVSMVRAVASSGPGCGLVVFPGCECPAGLEPTASASACFRGLGSGSWATAALAVGLGVPVVVFGVPGDSLPYYWGTWSVAGTGAWAEGFMLTRPVQQLNLF